MANVPDRPQKIKLKELEEALEAAGWDVGWTTNLHLSKPGGELIIVETFDEAGDPHLYTSMSGRDELVQVGGNLEEPIDCLTVGDVLEAAEAVNGRHPGSPA